MSEIDYLKVKLEDKEKAFDKLYERYIKLLKEQGELEKENEQLKLANGEMEDYLARLEEKNEQLKQQLFETSKELLWVTSDEVDKALYYEDEVKELRKEIFE